MTHHHHAQSTRRPADQINHLKASADLLALLGGPFRRIATTNGGEYAGPCPFCGGEDRCRVQPHAAKGGRWFCRQCTSDHWYDVFDYLRRKYNLNFADACTWLEGTTAPAPTAARVKREPKPNTWKSSVWQWTARAEQRAAIQQLLHKPAGEPGRAYLQQRGINLATARAWNLGFHPQTWHPQQQARTPAIHIPWWNGQYLTAIQYRFIGADIAKRERFGQHQGGQRLLCGLPLLNQEPILVLVEGEFNALAIWQACRDIGVDVLSWGAQENILQPQVSALTAMIIRRGYRRTLIWADEEALAHQVRRQFIRRTSGQKIAISSPLNRDANDLLVRDELRAYLATFLENNP